MRIFLLCQVSKVYTTITDVSITIRNQDGLNTTCLWMFGIGGNNDFSTDLHQKDSQHENALALMQSQYAVRVNLH
jgi:hypothetical protein